MESIVNGLIGGVLMLFGMLMGFVIFGSPEIEIQNVKQVDNGYYITINNEIYYREVKKDVE